MKRLISVAVLAMVIASLFAVSALAAGPVGGRWAQNGAPQAPNAACPMGGQGGGMMGRPAWAGQPDEVAALLGMTAEEIHAERLAGKSLAQIAQSKGVSTDTLVATMLTAKKAALQQAVTDGKLTQAQADLMVERMMAQMKIMVERTTTGPMGGRGMMGGMRGQGRGMMGQGLGQNY
jgi:lambda repressor-like predicted transcriptional regulator